MVTSKDGVELAMVTREHTQFEHHLMEREASMAPKLEVYLQSFMKLQKQNEVVSENITRMEARAKEMGEEGEASKHKIKMLALQLVEYSLRQRRRFRR